MNERILELALQAGVTGHFAAGTEYATLIPLSDEVQKFAELLVKECASKVDWIYSEKGKTADGVEYTVTQGDLIREHFGVKE